ncbi:hypothetical protein CSB20_03230 [bacterium DOLZORAL124_64_63]|nr:MAG: hypothetical protein CSB20_03230 [bacterium DOLZORAL124_64_63]
MSSVKETMKHAGIYSTAAMLGKLVGFLMLPFYAHILQGEGYAVIGLLDAGLALIISLLGYGVRGASIRLYHAQEDPQDKKAVISTGVYLVLVATLLYTVPLMVFSRPLAGLLLDNPDYSRLIIMALVGLVFEMAGQGASCWLLIRSRSIQYTGINLLRLLTGLSLNIWLIVILQMGLDGYFISALVTSVLSNSILMYHAFRGCGARFSKPLAKQILAFLTPLIPGNLVSFASQQAERYLVRFQIDLASVGVLEMGYKFPVIIVQFVTTPFMQSWNTRRFEMADEPGAPVNIGRMFTYYLFLATYIALVMAVVIRPVLVILTPPEFHLAYRVAWAEILALVMAGSYYHLTFGLLYAKDTGTLARIRGWTSVFKVGLSWFFITTFGFAGAAWSGAIIAAVSLFVGYRLSQRRYAIVLEWSKILLITGTALGIFFVLTGWDPAGTALFRFIEGKMIPSMAQLVSSSPLGDWKDGKLPDLLSSRSRPLALALVMALFSMPYGLLSLMVHDGTKRKVSNFLRFRSR